MEQGIKENQGKTDYSEINLGILDLMAERFTANKHKYPKGNMKKPINPKELEWALFRHVKKMIQPFPGDPENYREHLAAVLCNASMLLDQLDKEKEREDKNRRIMEDFQLEMERDLFTPDPNKRFGNIPFKDSIIVGLDY